MTVLLGRSIVIAVGIGRSQLSVRLMACASWRLIFFVDGCHAFPRPEIFYDSHLIGASRRNEGTP